MATSGTVESEAGSNIVGNNTRRVTLATDDPTALDLAAIRTNTATAATGSALVTKTDRSGTVTLGGTAQTLAAANASRRGFSIQNTSAGDLWFSTEATAVALSPSFKIPPNALYEEPAHGVDGGAISIIGATTGQAFSAREW
jgi:hypothetical protein